jgi:hypothetical protein
MHYVDTRNGRDHLVSIEQRIAVSKLRAEGFTQVEDGSKSLVVMVKGNDRRVIWLDGSVHRATGAKR